MAAPTRLPLLLIHPAVIVVATLATHAAGRVAAFCDSKKVDSFTYAVAAHRMWQPMPMAEALVADKPPGQAILTGWVFRVLPAPPARTSLIAVESACMLGAAAAFFFLARLLHGARVGLLVTGGFVLATQSYNAFDSTTDGFNLAENYLPLPIVLAVLAHLGIRRSRLGGLTCGLGLGLALSIKQTALAVVVAIFLHAVLDGFTRRGLRDRGRQLSWAVAGTALVWLPAAAFVAWKGLWAAQFDGLIHRSAPHFRFARPGLPTWAQLAPLSPLLLWIALGLAAVLLTPGAFRSRPRLPSERMSAALFVSLWLAAESVMVWMMTKPAEHYFQALAAPAALLAGFGVAGFQQGFRRLRATERLRLARLSGVATACLVVATALPILALARRNGPSFDPDWERAEFARRLGAVAEKNPTERPYGTP